MLPSSTYRMISTLTKHIYVSVYDWKTGKYTTISTVSSWVARLEIIFIFFILSCAFQISYKEQLILGGMGR